MSIICSFFGHRDVGEEIRPYLYTEIERHITEQNVDVFYVGGYGNFDGMASGILHNMKKQYPHISVYRILAYMPGKKPEYEMSIEQHPTLYPDGLELVPYKFAITHCNRWIVNESDFIIAYVRTSYGGAYDALTYAKQKNKNIINLANIGKR